VLTELDAVGRKCARTRRRFASWSTDLLLPHFDTEYSARQVLGAHWREASADQRKRFIEAFYQSLLQNYGEALLDFTPDRLKILPYREDPSDKTRATVRTEIRRDNGSRVPVKLYAAQTRFGWKAWDVTIEGISYVNRFRTDFASEIDQKGLDAVITRLEANQAGSSTAKSAKPAAKK